MAGRQGVVLAKMQGEVVGMAATKPGFDAQLLAANFKMYKSLPAAGTDQQPAELAMCIINPIFARSVGMFLAGRFLTTARQSTVYIAKHHLYNAAWHVQASLSLSLPLPRSLCSA